MTNINEGKKLFATYSEANKVAESMSRIHKEGFEAYKVGNEWAVGGVHTKAIHKKQKVKSFDDIRILLDEFKDSESDTSVEEYISDIVADSVNKESSIQGENFDWILKDVDLKLGRDIGMAASNDKKYLVLMLEKGLEKLTLKMGGNFSRHIPLIKKQAESLKDSAVIWHTWNSSTSSWGTDSWFYRLEKKVL
jgi:hypothetical protein